MLHLFNKWVPKLLDISFFYKFAFGLENILWKHQITL